MNGESMPVRSPADRRDVIGEVVCASNEHVGRAMERARGEFHNWESTPAVERAAILDRAATMMQNRLIDLVALIVREGGRTPSRCAL